jgi:hypothetical protein
MYTHGKHNRTEREYVTRFVVAPYTAQTAPGKVREATTDSPTGQTD